MNYCISGENFVSLQQIIIMCKTLNRQGFATAENMLNIDLNFENVPNGWALCFNENCKMKDACLRYMAGQKAPDDLTTATCVTPRALKDDECKKFAAERYDTEAWGMSHLFDGVQHDHYGPMRDAIFAILGRRNYYRYNKGERRLSMKQQQQIANLFKRYGYDDAPTFDHYVTVLQFPF